MSKAWLRGLAVGAAVAVGTAAPAGAQVESRESIAMQNQILELRHQLDQMRAQGVNQGSAPSDQPSSYQPPPPATAGGSGGSGNFTAQLLDRVSQLEDQVRQLRGRIDEVDNARQRSAEDLGKQIGDLQFRLNPGAAGLAASPPPPPPPRRGAAAVGAVPAPQSPPTPAPRRTPEIALQAGNAALAQRDYAAAEADAREVLASGRGPRATDAQYMLAQALAGRHDYQSAAVAYDDAYNRNARGARAPDSLLGLADSLIAIGEKKAACQTLDKLRVEFPTPRPDLRDAASAARSRAACR